MSQHPAHLPDRLLDLLADQVFGELSQQDAIELDRLLREHPGVDTESMEIAAAGAMTALCPPADEPMPDSLRDKLIAGANAASIARHKPIARVAPQESPSNPNRSWFPWMLAAASIAIASFVWIGSQPGAAPSIDKQYQAFITKDAPTDLVRIDWAAQPDPLVTEQLAGEVVWSQSRQKGYMKFSGLRANDPTVEQYQLWIFDGSREHPVDGGVFDIDADGNAIIPIDAKLAVLNPTLFAVTIEKPGGVVVSKKERIAVVAPIEQS